MMKYCKNCGAAIDENAQFCTACGTKVAPAETATVPEAAPCYSAPSPAPAQSAVSRSRSITALVLGIVSLSCCWIGIITLGIGSIISIVCGIIGIVKAKSAVSIGDYSKMGKTGKILSIIGLVLGGLFFIIGLIVGIGSLALLSSYSRFYY